MSNDDLRMSLADIIRPQELAGALIQELGLDDAPIDIEYIATQVGISCIHKTPIEGDFEGILVADSAKDKGEVWLNPKSFEARQRFTLAHEIGHFLLPRHNANAQCTKADVKATTISDSNKERENEANIFASSLLMPHHLFLNDMRKLGPPELSHILSLADQYNVSKEAAAIRYTSLCEEPCAIVFTHKGKTRYTIRSKDFPFIIINAGAPLPRHCPILQSDIQQDIISDWFETSLDAWTSHKHYHGQYVLTGQHLDYGDKYRMAMLLFPDDIE